MEKLTREEIEMCEIAVGIVIDRLDFTSENKAKWEALFDRLEVLQRETCLTPLAVDGATVAEFCECGISIKSHTGVYCIFRPATKA